MKKRITALLMAVVMVIGATACGKEEAKPGNSGASETSTQIVARGKDTEVQINDILYHPATDLTDEEITLTYFHFDQDETVKYLADRFMELYPNIKVVPTYENVSTYMDTLVTLISNGQTPDVIMYSDADTALSNMMLMDISQYWDADPETKNLADTINAAGIGTFQTNGRYAVPVKFFPGVMFIDRNVLETLNVDIPGQDWTWKEMIQLIKDCTQVKDGKQYYGLGVYNRLDSYYGIASSQDIIGEFGYDGLDFDLGMWAVGEQEFSDLKIAGYVAPDRETQANEDWTGNWELWFGATGLVAMFSEAFWTYMSSWAPGIVDPDLNLDIVPYVIPAVSEADANADHHSIATIDFGGVSSSCKHPREAYELLKFMSFGVDGWKTRIEMYNDDYYTDANGLQMKYSVMPVPITKDKDVWEQYIQMFTQGMDNEHVEAWRTYFASCLQPIPFGWTSIAGYWNYCDEYFNSIGIHNLVDTGVAKAADYAVEATEKANYFHARAMVDYFGPDGYDVLTKEQLTTYQNMVKQYEK